jgi:hypothetical protein
MDPTMLATRQSSGQTVMWRYSIPVRPGYDMTGKRDSDQHGSLTLEPLSNLTAVPRNGRPGRPGNRITDALASG